MTLARRRLAAALAVTTALAVAPATAAAAPWQARVYFDPHSDLRALAAAGEVEWFSLRGGFAVMRVDAAGWARLVALGHRLELTFEPPRRRAPSPTGSGAIAGFSCYRTVDALLARGAELAASRPEVAQWLDIGDSWEKTASPDRGDDLRLLRLTRLAVPGPKPVLMVIGGIHPREYGSPELALRFAEALLARDGVDPDVTWLLDRTEIQILVLANPDGRRRAETGLPWRKNADNLFCPDGDDRGVDLNRNFSFQWSCCGGGSDDPCSQLFRGPGPSSEPEVQAIEDRLRLVFPDVRPDDLVTPAPDTTAGLVLDLHGPGEQVLGPWGFSATPPPNASELVTLGRRLAFAADYFPFPGSLSTVDGASKDFAYGALGVPAFTIELGVDFFDHCPYFELAIAPRNLEMLLTAAKLALAPYRAASGPDVVAVRGPAEAQLAGTPTAPVTARADDTRSAQGNGTEPSQPIAAAEVCVDHLPGEPGAPCEPLAPVDGAFDSAVEELTGSVPTANLAPGRHQLYVQATDASGATGPPTAAFLTVLDPATRATISGRVRHADTHGEIAAELEMGPFKTDSPGIGGFRMGVPPGAYTLRATAEAFAPRTLSLSLGAGDERSVVLDLSPWATAFADGAEGSSPWTAEPPWATTSATAASGARSWTDSPDGNYLPDTDASLTSPVLDLQDAVAVELEFAQRFDLFRGFDLAQVEISTDGGATWSVVGLASEEQQTLWRTERIALPELAGQAQARFRFHLLTRSPVTRDGWYVDDIRLKVARPGAYLFADGFEDGTVSRWSGSSTLP